MDKYIIIFKLIIRYFVTGIFKMTLLFFGIEFDNM